MKPIRRHPLLALITLSAAMASAVAGALTADTSLPAAVSSDPPVDAAHPAAMTVIHIPSHGVRINGVVYQPSGAGPHATLVICHGLPGNEKNLDLAQAVRRAGWNAVTFNYRGSWGSPGSFRFKQNLQDADAVLAYLRVPANATKLGIDTHRIVIIGHSMGGWVAVHTAAHDYALSGLILVSAADMGVVGEIPHAKLVAEMADNMESLSGVTAESMANDTARLSKAYRFDSAVTGLHDMPLLILTADDDLAPHTDRLIQAIAASGGGQKITTLHVATDHGWSDHRIELESVIINWLNALP
jgi:uncharacterized protein